MKGDTPLQGNSLNKIATYMVLLAAQCIAASPAVPAARLLPLKVALLLSGRVNDPGYYNAGYEALLAVKEHYHAETVYQEELKAVDAELVMRALAENGENYILVMGGGVYDDAIRDVAADYPHVKFIIISGTFTQVPNIVSIRTGNPGVPYLAGALMALMSRSGRIGLIGGRATPPAVTDHQAVLAGARAVNPSIQAFDTFTDSYDDPAMGKEAGLAQIERGADILFTNANTTSFGVFQAAEEKHVLAIGAATDQNSMAPDTILTSAVYGMDKAVLYLIDLDEHHGWQQRIYTMDLRMVDLAPFHSLGFRVSPQVRERLELIRQQLIDGTRQALPVPGAR